MAIVLFWHSSGSRVSLANLRVATVSVLSLFDQKINPLVMPAMKTHISVMKLLLAFALGGLLLLCATYYTVAYCRLVSIAKGIELYG
jgi:hypothetical protein